MARVTVQPTWILTLLVDYLLGSLTLSGALWAHVLGIYGMRALRLS